MPILLLTDNPQKEEKNLYALRYGFPYSIHFLKRCLSRAIFGKMTKLSYLKCVSLSLLRDLNASLGLLFTGLLLVDLGLASEHLLSAFVSLHVFVLSSKQASWVILPSWYKHLVIRGVTFEGRMSYSIPVIENLFQISLTSVITLEDFTAVYPTSMNVIFAKSVLLFFAYFVACFELLWDMGLSAKGGLSFNLLAFGKFFSLLITHLTLSTTSYKF